MKKLSLAVAVATAIGTGAALAVDGGYDHQAGFAGAYLVPQVVHNGAGDTTAIGVTWSCQPNTGDDRGGNVYWAFFDENSDHVTDGQFKMTKNDFHGLIWADVAGLGTEGINGYMVLAADRDDPATVPVDPNGVLDGIDDGCISVSALQVQTMDDDVIFVPTAPVEIGDINYGVGAFPAGISLANVAYDPIAILTNGARAGDSLYMRYFIDGVQDNDEGTDIVLWSAGHFKGKYTIQQYNTEEQRKSVTVDLNKELNIIDPEKLVGAEPTFLDGFLLWSPLPDLTNHLTPPNAWGDKKDGDGFFSYSKIFSAGFGAKQTILNAFHKGH